MRATLQKRCARVLWAVPVGSCACRIVAEPPLTAAYLSVPIRGESEGGCALEHARATPPGVPVGFPSACEVRFRSLQASSLATARARALSISASRSASCTPYLHRPPDPSLAGSRSVRCHRPPAMLPSLATALPSLAAALPSLAAAPPSLAAAPPSLLLLASHLSLAALSSPSPVVESR